MRRLRSGRWPRDPRLLGLFLACSLALAGALAARSHHALRAQRRSAERDLRKEVEFAAFIPARAAQAIITAATGDDPPLRLPLHELSVETSRKKLASVAADLDRMEPLARSVHYAGPTT